MTLFIYIFQNALQYYMYLGRTKVNSKILFVYIYSHSFPDICAYVYMFEDQQPHLFKPNNKIITSINFIQIWLWIHNMHEGSTW